jgi:hypothetical protein
MAWNPPQRPGSTPYGEYRDSGWTWTNSTAWGNASGIDPNTGALTGPGGLVPANYALQFQAMHDQAVWGQQQRLLRQGMDYTRGALGLLQSYRPGGSAAIASNIYGQLGQASFQRAQLTQPMDLMGDYRRHETAVARQKANRQSEIGTAVQIGAIAAGAVTGGLGYGAIAAGLGGLAAGMAAGRASQDPNQNYGDPSLSGQSTSSSYITPEQAQPIGPSQGPTGAGPTMGPQGAGGGQALGAQSAPSQPGAPGAQAPQGQKQVAQGGQQQSQPGQPGGAGMGAPPVGLDGNFSPVAYAASRAHSLTHPIQQMAMSRMLATQLENDEVLQAFSVAIDQRLMARYRGAA